MARKCEHCDSDIINANANYCAHCGNELHDRSGFIKTNTPAIKLNKMRAEILVSSVVKVLFYIFKLVMSVIGIFEVKELARHTDVAIMDALFIASIVIVLLCLIDAIALMCYGVMVYKYKFPVKKNEVFAIYKKAMPCALMLIILGGCFLAVCTPAEWLLTSSQSSLTSFRQNVDAGAIAKFVGDVVVDILFILLSLIAYLHCKHISRSAYEHLERVIDEDVAQEEIERCVFCDSDKHLDIESKIVIENIDINAMDNFACDEQDNG